ncbi:MAG: hypothetical protein ABJN14_15175 [Paracoccaceae bacterium]
MSILTFWGRTTSVLTLATYLLIPPEQAEAQVVNLAKCEGLWFSTSEDFLATARSREITGAPSSTTTIISDGDLLSFQVGAGSQLCARNEELLRPFDIERFDHGLDALDKVVFEESVVIGAFSTELDSINTGQFTAGDLLFTNGVIVPNAALLARFGLPSRFDLGLDAVHIEGGPRELRELLSKLADTDPNTLRENPGLLAEILEGTNTDILFSTEGTPPEVQKPLFLDGDLLSAKTGTIVRGNADLLPAMPAGLPTRGVDYGLDAYTPSLDPIELVPVELFSTEVNVRKNTLSDGDVLSVGPGLYLRNLGLLGSFNPLDIDMGLDALADRPSDIVRCGFGITAISHIDVNARIDSVTGLYDTDRAFGRDLRVQGNVPGRGCPRFQTHEFQVRVSIDGAPEQPVFHPSSLNWMTSEAPCIGLSVPYASDAGGWFSLTQYQRVVDCPNDESLGIWRSAADMPNAVGTVTMRIALRPIGGGGPEVFSAPIRVRVDNKRPEDVTMALYQPGETEPFLNQCKIDGNGEPVLIDIRGTFTDDHFRMYDLTWSADGNITGSVPDTGLGRTYNSRPELSDTGTSPTPPATNVLLENFDLTAAFAVATGGDPLIECGYSIRMRVFDRTRLGGTNFSDNLFSANDSGNQSTFTQSFCLIP